MIKEKIIANIGVIYLNRPQKLNALTMKMFDQIEQTLERWRKDDNIRAVLFDSLSTKAFCAGGDIKEIYDDYLTNDACRDKAGFLAREFDLDKYIMNYDKPIISHWIGLVMGGGVGLAIHSDYIVCDQSVSWAMPETKLGFVPDVGVGKFISKLPQAVGQYVGLCGESLAASDLINYGLADSFIDSKDYEQVSNILFDLSKEFEGDKLINEFGKAVNKLAQESRATEVSRNLSKINKYFCKNTISDVFSVLEENINDDFAKSTYDNLKTRDPFMLAVQFEKYFLGKQISAEQTYDLDLKIIRYAIDKGSINEGIKSVVIDKSYKAKWPVKSINEVSMKEVKTLLNIDKTYKESLN